MSPTVSRSLLTTLAAHPGTSRRSQSRQQQRVRTSMNLISRPDALDRGRHRRRRPLRSGGCVGEGLLRHPSRKGVHVAYVPIPSALLAHAVLAMADPSSQGAGGGGWKIRVPTAREGVTEVGSAGVVVTTVEGQPFGTGALLAGLVTVADIAVRPTESTRERACARTKVRPASPACRDRLSFQPGQTVQHPGGSVVAPLGWKHASPFGQSASEAHVVSEQVWPAIAP